MADKELSEYINEFFSNLVIDGSYSKKKSLICSMYLLKFMNDRDKDAYDIFVLMFKNLDYENQIQVFENVRKALQKNNKVKIRKK